MSADTSPVLKDQFVQGMSHAACTVNIVTTDGKAGRGGLTVSAMSSVSAEGDYPGDAPSLLICVHHLSPVAKQIIENGCFCTSLLRDDQAHISDTFAGRQPRGGGDKFSCGDWQQTKTGALRVADALVAFDCKIKSHQQVGTHHIFLGEVQEVFVSSQGNPLVYANRAYGSPVRFNAVPQGRKSDHRFRIGALHSFGPLFLPGIFHSLREEIGDFELDLYEGDQRYLVDSLQSGSIDYAFIYDIGLDESLHKHKISALPPYVLLPESHALVDQHEISLRELLEHPMVLLDAPPSSEYFLSLFDGIGAPRVAYRAKTYEMARGMVAYGLGYTLLTTRPAALMSYDGKALAARPIAESPPPCDLVLCRRGDAEPGADMLLFLKQCRKISAR